MDDRDRRAKQLFLEVRELSRTERVAALDKDCGDDEELRARVQALLEDSSTVSMPVGEEARSVRPTPKHIGPYRIARELGRGGMGIVYLGVRDDDRFKRRAAIKVVKRGMDTEDILRRFELERQLLAALNHPGIARLYDGGETEDGLPYFAEEYVDGLPIDEYCDAHRLRIAERLELFRKVCSAVHYAHQNLVVHRDLKPSNIIVSGEGIPKLLDFGIAKLLNPALSPIEDDPTSPEYRIMTPEYASPEQVRGHPISTASDVYSLGVLLYRLVTGHRPYHIRSHLRAEIERIVCEVDPAKPSTAISRIEEADAEDPSRSDSSTTITPEGVSRVREGKPDRLRRRLVGDIDNIVLMAMRKEPQRRYKSAEEFAEDLRRHLEGLPVRARRDTFGYRSSKFIRRHRLGVGAAAAILVLLVGGVVGTASGWRAEAVERERAYRMFNQVRALAHTFMFDFHEAVVQLDGSIPARQLLVSTALEYIDGLAEEVQDDAALIRELAFAYDRVGEIRGGDRNPSLGDTAGALESYRAALELREGLDASLTDEPDLKKELLLSYMNVGDMMVLRGNIAGARGAYRQALDISEQLANDDPTHRRHLMMQLNNVGAVLKKTGKLNEAQRHYERALAICEQLAAEQPEKSTAQRALSVALNRRGEVLVAVGDHEAALTSYLRALEIRQRLADADPESGRFRRDLAIEHYIVGDLLTDMDRPQAAASHVRHFRDVCEQRTRDNPQSARARRDLAIAHDVQGRLSIAAGNGQAALESFQNYRDIMLGLSNADQDNSSHRTYLASSHERIAQARQLLDDRDGTITAYRQALQILTELIAGDREEVRLQESKARVLCALGDVLNDSGQVDEAQRMLEAALQEYESLLKLQPEHAAVRLGLATTLNRLSRSDARAGRAQAAARHAEEALGVLKTAPPGSETEALRRTIIDVLEGLPDRGRR